MNTNNHFGQVLKIYLKKNGITQKFLAGKMGIHVVSVFNYIQSKEPKLATKTKILEALGISESEMFGEKPTEYVLKSEYEALLHEKFLLMQELMQYKTKEIEQLKEGMAKTQSPN